MSQQQINPSDQFSSGLIGQKIDEVFQNPSIDEVIKPIKEEDLGKHKLAYLDSAATLR